MGNDFYNCSYCNEISCTGNDEKECKKCYGILCDTYAKKQPKQRRCNECAELEKNCKCGNDENPQPTFANKFICKYCTGKDITDANLIKFLLGELNISRESAMTQYNAKNKHISE